MSQLQTLTLRFTRIMSNKSLLFKVKRVSLSHLKASVGSWMTEVVESPWLRGGVYRFPLEFRCHTISPRKLKYTHGNGPFLPGQRQRDSEEKKINSTMKGCKMNGQLVKSLLYN